MLTYPNFSLIVAMLPTIAYSLDESIVSNNLRGGRANNNNQQRQLQMKPGGIVGDLLNLPSIPEIVMSNFPDVTLLPVDYKPPVLPTLRPELAANLAENHGITRPPWATMPPAPEDGSRCYDLGITEAIRVANNEMDEPDVSFACIMNSFMKLGETQDKDELALWNGYYLGKISLSTYDMVAQIANDFNWLGMDCDMEAKQCTMKYRRKPTINDVDEKEDDDDDEKEDDDNDKNKNKNNNDPAVGSVKVNKKCGMKIDKFPCIEVQFKNGTNPRTYYIRKMDDSTYASMVVLEDGTYYEVNTLRP